MQTNPTKTYISLGSNLDSPILQIRTALQELCEIPQTHVIKTSQLYRNPPLGPANQPDFINAVACLETQLRPGELLIQLQKIEQQHHRIRTEERFAPRTLDLDILLFGEEQINDPNLIIPHYALRERVFYLFPLYEIAPNLQLPNGEYIKDYLKGMRADELVPLC